MSHPSPKWENIEFVPANWSHYGGDIESFLNISDESGENSSLPNNTFLLRNVRQYYDFEPPILIVSLLPFSISIVLQAFAINYEKTEMDPMKRGFTNQVRISICIVYTNSVNWNILGYFRTKSIDLIYVA